MTKLHPIFEQALAPFLKPIATRNGPVEIWRPVVGYEGIYEVSDLGQVRSLPRVPPSQSGRGYFARKGRILSATPRNKYPAVLLYKNRDRAQANVHELVLNAFVGPRPEGMQASHLDGNPTNNAATNLEWATPKQNNAEKIRHGTQDYGENHHASRLTADDVRTIFRMDSAGCTLKEIANDVGISASQVRNIINGHNWKHLRDDFEDRTPWCSGCGAMRKTDCHCGPLAENE